MSPNEPPVSDLPPPLAFATQEPADNKTNLDTDAETRTWNSVELYRPVQANHEELSREHLNRILERSEQDFERSERNIRSQQTRLVIYRSLLITLLILFFIAMIPCVSVAYILITCFKNLN